MWSNRSRWEDKKTLTQQKDILGGKHVGFVM